MMFFFVLLARIFQAITFYIYRVTTILQAFWVLYRLPESKVQAFLDSYAIYDHDWKNQKEMIAEMGEGYYETVQRKLVDYYSVVNYLCAIGDVEKMYIPPAIDLSVSIIENQVLFERRMAKDLGLDASKNVLDIGCGRGRVAAHMAKLSGATVTGFNIDETQLDSGRKNAARNGLKNLTFQFGDVNAIPFAFPDAHFDNIYHVQVFSLAKDLPLLFNELYRLLKPGGKFACLDYVLKDAYNPSNPHHGDLLKRTKPLLGAIGSPTVEEYAGGLARAGFNILVSEDASAGGHQAPLIDKAHVWYTSLGLWVQRLVRWGVLPRHFQTLFERLSDGGDAFCEADKLGLLTTSWYIVAQKPLA
eukprot:gnl/Spiro4/4778_TR2397_c0_g1_i1.p1 gnl/Spiro4/4778_TR2397_c0_g1~~gnl/Spiro4/4778_TR2397_c0_g1_i1.p1  ORF type:complete len:381 (-),score=86.53 gnl/Spiro4/4778_TR2397_c0_g1_i1:195-1271(-)